MFELVMFALLLWLLVKSARLAVRLSWGLAKGIATALLMVSVPLLILCLLFLGGLALLIPLVLIGLAFGIAKNCTY